MIRLRQLAAGNFMRRGLCLALLVTFCGFSRAADAQGPPYTFTKVQVPGSVYTDATGINNSGQVVGTYYSADGKRHGYKFDGGTYTTIDFPGALHSFLFGIDVAGRTVGSYSLVSGNGPWHSFIADSGNFSSFDFPNKESDGRAINGAGRIVGIYNSGPATPDTGYLKVDDSYETISVLGAQHTYALGINDAGRISGSYVGADGVLRGFVRSGGLFSVINFPGATQTLVGGINNSDTIVGWSQKGVNPTHGFVMAGSRLRAFDVALPGAVKSYPQALNDNGQVAGNYFSADCPNGCGFLATPQIGGLPSCDQNLTLSYAAGTLKLKFTGFRTSMPLTWMVSVVALGSQLPLWSAPLGAAISPAQTFEVPLAFPPVGTTVGVSLLVNGTGDVLCMDYATVNAGP